MTSIPSQPGHSTTQRMMILDGIATTTPSIVINGVCCTFDINPGSHGGRRDQLCVCVCVLASMLSLVEWMLLILLRVYRSWSIAPVGNRLQPHYHALPSVSPPPSPLFPFTVPGSYSFTMRQEAHKRIGDGQEKVDSVR